jgi:hypothetical protein
LGCRAHLRVVRESAKGLEAAEAAATRHSGWTTRRRGSGTPARALRCYGARTRQQATPVCSSPLGAALGQLHVDETAATARNRRWRRELEFRVSAAHEARAARARVGKDPGGGAALNSPGNPVLACGPRTGGSARVGLGGGGGVPVG